MRTLPVLSAILLAATTSAQLFPPASQKYTGAIQGYLNVETLNDTFDYFASVMPEFLRKNNEETSFDLDLVNGWFWNMHVYSVKVKQFKIDKRSIKAVSGENGKPNSLVFEISNADLEGQPIGGFQFANLQMFNLTQVRFTGLRMKIEVSILRDDNLTEYWQVAGASEIDFADLQFKTDSPIINTAFDLFHGMIVRYLQSYENGYG
jgi:hypothetical protein